MRKIILLFSILSLGHIGFSATITSNGTGGGVFNAGGSWQGGTAPGAADDVIILEGDVIKPTGNFNSCKSIEIQADGNFFGFSNLQFDNSTGTVILNVTNDITFTLLNGAAAGGPTISYLSPNASSPIGGGYLVALNIGGNFINPLDGSMNFFSPNSSGTTTGIIVSYNGTSGTQTIVAANYFQLKLQGNSAKVFDTSGDISVFRSAGISNSSTGAVTTTNSTVNYAGYVNQTVSKTLNYFNLKITNTGSTVTLDGSGTINVAGTFTSATTAAYTVTGNTVNFNGTSGAISNPSGTAVKFNILTENITGGGTLSAGTSPISVLGNMTITTGTYSGSSALLAVTGNFSNAGSYNASTGALTVGGTLTNTGTFTGSSGNVTSTGNFFNTAGTFTAPSTNLFLGGNYTNSGTFNHNNGTVTFNGSPAAPSITGATTFFDLNLNNTGSHTLTLNNVCTINDNVSVTQGVIAAGASNLVLASTGRVGTSATAGAYITGSVNLTSSHGAGFTGWTNLGSQGLTNLTFASWNPYFTITCPSCPNGSTVQGSAFTSITSFNEATDAFPGISNTTDAIDPKTGYWVWLGTGFPNSAAIDITVAGTPLMGDQAAGYFSLTASGAGADKGWNLIPNPYPSPISWAALRATQPASFVNNEIHVYNPNNGGGAGGYSDYSGGTSNPLVGSGGIGDAIPIGQAFYVVTTSATTLQPKESIKISSNQVLLKNSGTTFNVPQMVFRLAVDGATKWHDETVFHFNSNATNGFDTDWDAHKMNSLNKGAVNISSKMAGVSYSINALPSLGNTANLSIPVIVNAGNKGSYTISPMQIGDLPAGACVTLHDSLNGNNQDLRTGSYTFSVADTTVPRIFSLNITMTSLATVTNASMPTCSNKNNGLITAKGNNAGPWNYTWKNSGGVIVKNTLGKTTADTLSNLASGVYSVDIHTVGSCDNGNQSFSIVSPPAPVSSFVPSVDTVYLSSGSAMVSFTNTSSNTNSYYWNFGNGNNSTSMNPSNIYTAPGVETVTLSAFNSNCSDTVVSNKIVVVLTPLGISNVTKSNLVNIGQDVTGTFVKFDYSNQTKTVISVYDILGQKAMNDINADVVNDIIYLDLNNVHQQILLISVTTEDKRVVKKIFKQ